MFDEIKGDIIARLNKFIVTTGWSNREIASKFNIREQHISKYLNGKLNLTKVSPYIYNAGCSIDWLYSGSGDMFAHNQAGRELREMIHTGKNFDFDTKLAKSRILEWIVEQHKDIETFSIENNYDINEIKETVYGEKHFLPSLINLLVAEGCNPKWIYGHSNTKFSKTKRGLELAEKARLALLDEIYKDTGIDLRRQISEPSSN